MLGFGRKSRWGNAGTIAAALLLAISCGEPRATAPKTGSSQDQLPGTNLLECPTNETATTSAIVGLLGGSVQLGATGISIPAGALTVPQLFQVTVPASNYMEIDVSAVGFQSFLFQQPVSITIDYSRCNRSNIDNQTLHVWHIDPLTHQLLEEMGGVVDDKISQHITFTTDHLSGYAVAN
jgi:hypothetical protein